MIFKFSHEHLYHKTRQLLSDALLARIADKLTSVLIWIIFICKIHYVKLFFFVRSWVYVSRARLISRQKPALWSLLLPKAYASFYCLYLGFHSSKPNGKPWTLGQLRLRFKMWVGEKNAISAGLLQIIKTARFVFFWTGTNFPVILYPDYLICMFLTLDRNSSINFLPKWGHWRHFTIFYFEPFLFILLISESTSCIFILLNENLKLINNIQEKH